MRVNYRATLIGVLATVISASAMAGPLSTGTGFAIGDGSVIVTAHHVVDGCTAIQIPDLGTATVLKSDPRADLAILKPSRPLPIGLRFRSGRSVKLGEEIVVIGYPLRGLLSSPPTVTTGIVSSLAGIRDDRTEMQISAPVQPGNSGGPVLDRSGNVVGVVESKLDAIKAAIVTGDIPQNVNFAIHSSIVASLLDSYTINYDIAPTGTDKPIAEIVAAAVPAVVIIECTKEERVSTSPLPPKPSPPPQEANTPISLRSASLCGRAVDYTVDRSESRSGFLGVWSGNWNNSGQLCGGLIVEKVHSDGTAELIYVYGPTQPGSKLNWKQQRRTGVLSNEGKLSFQDEQGSTFVFDLVGSGTLNATFLSRSGRLGGSFQKF
jgi:S1-C subfamily serine protease